MRRGQHDDQPILITSAPESYDDEYERRKRKYAIMMSLRAVCVIAATLTYHVSVVLALGFIVGGAVLPWCAVLIANDRPARKRAEAPNLTTGGTQERALPPTPHDGRTVDG